MRITIFPIFIFLDKALLKEFLDSKRKCKPFGVETKHTLAISPKLLPGLFDQKGSENK